ncbi:MAG: copper resistance system multicopper oxidase [Chloroflexota bacterium]|nr:copper resistance system multicopper oxidase [Chloroflexota bacterium]
MAAKRFEESSIVRGLGRRHFVQGVAAAGTLAGLGSAMRPWRALAAPAQMPLLSGSRFDLSIGPTPVNITGRRTVATGVNKSVPGPVLRWRQGDTVTLNVTNRLDVPTSIHWHGIRSPSNMDGVPGLSFRGIAPGATYVYRIPLHQSGTYWYHSHSAFQEQTGLYGAIIVEPQAGYPVAFNRDYVIVLSDWTDINPEEIVSNLKFQSDYYNFHQRTVGTFFSDVGKHGLRSTLTNRLEWGRMRMSPTDIADVTGHTYTYVLNGLPPRSNWTGLFRPGERVRLRFINASSMTFFDVRIPGLTMSVVEADGNSVVPVDVDEFRIGVAETYDVMVRPTQDRAYTIFAQSEDRSGYARGTLATRTGMAGPVPPMDPRPIRTMTDMGMGNMDMSGNMAGMSTNAGSAARAAPDHPGGMPSNRPSMPTMPTSHGGMSGMQGRDTGNGSMPGMGMSMGSMAGIGMDQGGAAGARAQRTSTVTKAVGHANTPATPMGGTPGMEMDHGNMAGMKMGRGSMGNMSGKDMGGMNTKLNPVAARMQGSPGVDNVAMMPTERLNEPGDGLNGNGRRVLTYADLRALQPGDDPRPPSREITLHLTGNMVRYMWGFDGKKFSQAEPIRLKRSERVRFTLINDTMMEHPIHLHGLWSELENGYGEYRPYKHTIIVKPGEKLSYLVTADKPGEWAYHCHLLYHMEMGMFRTVVVA